MEGEEAEGERVREDPLRRCRRLLLNDFTIYDQTVDIVSCWQAFLEKGYKPELTYFDRYPEMGPDSLTPDFAALFREKEYGLVGEIKRTLPRPDVALKKELKQLLSYDGPLPFRTKAGRSEVTPALHDIVLVLHSPNMGEMARRINAMLATDEFRFQRNLILMEYQFTEADRVSRYIIRKYAGENRSFRDKCIPHDRRLETILGDLGRDMHIPVREFMGYKLTEVLCNDQPPPIYLAAFLWNKVFYNFLSNEQRKEWARGNPLRILPISIKVPTLADALKKDYIPGGRVRQGWVRDTLEFLRGAELAEQRERDEYEVSFSNRTSLTRGSRLTEPGEKTHHEGRELAAILAEEYCRGRGGYAELPPAQQKTLRQKTLPGMPPGEG